MFSWLRLRLFTSASHDAPGSAFSACMAHHQTKTNRFIRCRQPTLEPWRVYSHESKYIHIEETAYIYQSPNVPSAWGGHGDIASQSACPQYQGVDVVCNQPWKQRANGRRCLHCKQLTKQRANYSSRAGCRNVFRKPRVSRSVQETRKQIINRQLTSTLSLPKGKWSPLRT